MSEINESKFNMWRAALSTIHVDGKVSVEEWSWAKNKIESLPLSEEQKAVLENDIKSPVSMESIIPKIEKKSDLAFVLHLIRTIGHLDEVYSDAERETFKSLEQEVMSGLDIEAIEKEVVKMEEDSYKLKLEVSNKDSIFATVIDWLKHSLGR